MPQILTSGASPRECPCRALAVGVFAHALAAGLDPDGSVHGSVHDRVGVNHGAEALVPLPSRVSGSKHC